MEIQNTDYVLVQVQTLEDWDDYHRIRREELLKNTTYDPNHPDEYLPTNHPLLLKWRGQGIGTTRLDLKPDNTAVVRLVAISLTHQGKGHGRELAKLVEKFALEKGVYKLLLNARPAALGYYEKLGYIRDDWDLTELTGNFENLIQMSKIV